jgi:type IV pilus assembly protein PilV
MLEVMISMVLLVTVLLGATALQITGLHTNRSAYYRTQASIIAYDIADRIRINGRYATGDNSRYSIDTSNPSIPTGSTCSTMLNGCSDAGIRDLDIREWSENFLDVTGVGKDGSSYQPALPGGVGEVTVSGANVSIQISWQELDWNVGGGSDKEDRTKQVMLEFTII